MPTTNPNQIIANAHEQITALQKIDLAFAAKINAIKDTEWNKPLTPTQLKQISDLRTRKAAVLSAIEELSYVTAGALDSSGELQRLANALAGITKDLKARQQDIANIGAAAQSFASVLDNINSLTKQISALAN
jgi:hypothetical protein